MKYICKARKAQPDKFVERYSRLAEFAENS